MIQISKPDFPISRLLATFAAMEAVEEAGLTVIDLLNRQISKDWGDVS